MSTIVVSIQDAPSVPVAVIRSVASASSLSKVVPEQCGLVWNELKAQGIKGGRNVAIYWNGDIKLEVGAELEGQFVEQHSVVRSATPAGRAATATHFGPYGGLRATHQAIHSWCAANGHRLAGPSWEVYGHWQREWDAQPSLIRTDVFYSVL